MKYPPRLIPSTIFAALLISPAFSGAQPLPEVDERYRAPAEFKVFPDVVNPDVEPVSVTIATVGNALFKRFGAFEPMEWRTMFSATADAEGRVYGDWMDLSRRDAVADGWLDGGFARIYRVRDGRLDIVCESRIPEGGHNLKGWYEGRLNRVVPEGTQRYIHGWDDTAQPGDTTWFAVASVDRWGNVSEKSEAVALTMPDNFADAPRPRNKRSQIRERDREDPPMPPPVPQNVEARVLPNGNGEITWDAVEADDLGGYLVFYSYHPPEQQTGIYLQLEDEDVQVKENDLVIIGKKRMGAVKAETVSPRLKRAEPRRTKSLMFAHLPWQDEAEGMSWRLVPHDPDTPVADPGETYGEFVIEEGATFTLDDRNHGARDQSYFEVLQPGIPYVVEMWMKYEGEGDGTVVFSTEGTFDESQIPPHTFKGSGEWKLHRHTFSVDETPEQGPPGKVVFEFKGPGTFSVDNMRMYRGDVDYLDWEPRWYERVAESDLSLIRTHAFIKTNTDTYSMEQFTNDGGAVSEGIAYKNTLPQTLRIIEKTGKDLWLQVELHMSPSEWAGFMEYMAAPYDPAVDTPENKPWAYKRYRQGREAPWMDAFDRVFFEISNETWNGLFQPWTFFQTMEDEETGEIYRFGQVYGLFQEYVMDELKSSPYWRAEFDDKVVPIIGNQKSSGYGFGALQQSPSSKYVTMAAYNGGWDEGEGPPQVTLPSFFNVLAQNEQSNIPRARDMLEKVTEANREREEPAKLGTYEAGPGYAMSGLNGANVSPEQQRQQEEVMKGKAAGTATLDSFLSRAYYGFKVDNFFILGEGSYWKSHAPWYHGGQAYPSWKLLVLFNKVGTGDFLKVETQSVPLVAKTPEYERRDAKEDVPMVAAYAMRQGDRVSVFLISRKVPNYPVEGDDGVTPVRVELPFSNAEKVSVYQLTGELTDNNLKSDAVGIETSELPAERFNGFLSVNLPPAGVQAYVFEGVRLPEGRVLRPEEVLGAE